MCVCRCCWELVDSGAWANSVVWLKPGGAYTAIRDDKVYTIKPDRDEGLWELQVRCPRALPPPEHLHSAAGSTTPAARPPCG